jgi:hypothetical protein
MSAPVTSHDILQRLHQVTDEFSNFCNVVPDQQFFRQPAAKWSVAQNVTHLITSANMTRLAYRLPKFVVRLYTGKPNRVSRSYDELVAKYKSKLEKGGKASGRFIAKPVDAKEGKDNILRSFRQSMEKLSHTFSKTAEADLDRYLAPHPLLGKITFRELGYFTIYHVLHHLAIVKERAEEIKDNS